MGGTALSASETGFDEADGGRLDLPPPPFMAGLIIDRLTRERDQAIENAQALAEELQRALAELTRGHRLDPPTTRPAGGLSPAA